MRLSRTIFKTPPIPLSAAILSAAAAFGILLRFLYARHIALDPALNLSLPGTDPFLFDMLAKNLASADPLPIQSPLNPVTAHFIGIIYRLFGAHPLPLYLIFAALGAISAFALAVTGSLLFGWPSGALAGVALLYYRMNFFYDAVIDGTALSQFLMIMSLFFFILYAKRERTASYALFLIFSLALCLSRSFYWLLIIPAIIVCLARFKQWKKTSLITINCCFALLAALGFQQMRSADGYAHKFGVHFYIGNRAGASGLMEEIPGIASTSEGFARDAILKAHEESGATGKLNFYWIRKTFQSYRGQPLAWAFLTLKKLSYLVNNYEPHNISSVYFYEKHSPLKRLPRLDFSVLFSLAAGGITMAFAQKHKSGRILLIPTVFLTIMALSVFICSRYRMPLIPFLCLYAGFAAERVAFFLKSNRRAALAALILIMISAALLSRHPVEALQKKDDISFWEMESLKAWEYRAAANGLREQFLSWDRLEPGQRILLTQKLEQHMMPFEFTKSYALALPLAQNDAAARDLLLSSRARFEERCFNFQRAFEIWRELERSPALAAQALEKTKELTIIGPLLDKNFIKK
ncbi:MAG TPA: glycosyltransferase family 39 protein [Candidatus Omnitrophota bacterium]|nr:glycosyltransferase family 39 protein [Candidatus Omnitrophota bacterium]HSA31376.1 glycosyltransferase family 39 protein [Candidatus Omnitrophota bacterium]